MLLTVTCNPAIDRTLELPHLKAGTVQRARSVRLAAGGKGLNVARSALRINCPVMATGSLAGHAGRALAALAASEGIPADWHWTEERETRSCMLINHGRRDATVINEPGPDIRAAEWLSFAAHLRRLAQAADAVAFSGSIPLETPGEAIALARSLSAPHRPVYLDTSGVALRMALQTPSGLSIKVNREELLSALDLQVPGRSLSHLHQYAVQVIGRGAALLVITSGFGGALAAAPEGCWVARPPRVQLISSVGSGDAFLAGLAAGRMRGETLESALTLAVACGAANAATPLPGHFPAESVTDLLSQVSVKRL